METPDNPEPLSPEEMELARATLKRTCRFLAAYSRGGPKPTEDPDELTDLLRGILDRLSGVEETERRDSEPPMAA